MDDAPKKFSFAEALLLLLLNIFADGLEMIIILMGVIPIITPIVVGLAWLINTLVLGIVLFVFIMKGERGLWFLSGSLLEYVPFVNILPLRTVTCAIAIYLANHPKLKSVASAGSGGASSPRVKTPKKPLNVNS